MKYAGENPLLEIHYKLPSQIQRRKYPVWRCPDEVWPHKVEGGDLLVLSDHAMAIGVSQRTAPTTVQRIGKKLAQNTPIRKIFAFEIPRERYCMHLDTVFTMVDKDAFTIFPTVISVLKVWEMDYDDNGILLSIKQAHQWKESIANELGFDKIRVIEMKGKDQAETDREQWHDGCNTLAVAPGKGRYLQQKFDVKQTFERKRNRSP
jgi:Arginine deiminase